MQMREEKDNLIDNLDYLLFEYKEKLPETFSTHDLKNLEELSLVVSNALNGKKEDGLNKLANVRNYLKQSLKYVHENYDYDNEEQQEDLELLLKEIIIDLEPIHFQEISNLVSSNELIGMKSLARQKNLPREMEGEILEFVGQKQSGGKRKKTKNAKKKTKKTTKNKTKKQRQRQKRKR
jgi:hypothetical protein